MQLITLTTDFGLADWFVGTMKGVILRLNPIAKIEDITHGIPPGDLRAGAFSLAASARFFPRGTVHMAVIDPGVGSARKALAVRTANYTFVGPDNGVLSWALRKEKIKAIHRLENQRYFLRPISHTFHGRDVFAPVAAHVARGVPLSKLGPKQRDFVQLPWPEPIVGKKWSEGEVIYIDHFGNAITNLGAERVRDPLANTIRIRTRKGVWVCPLKTYYSAVEVETPAAIVGSSGFLEIAVNGGSAAELLGLRIGTRVRLGD